MIQDNAESQWCFWYNIQAVIIISNYFLDRLSATPSCNGNNRHYVSSRLQSIARYSSRYWWRHVDVLFSVELSMVTSTPLTVFDLRIPSSSTVVVSIPFSITLQHAYRVTIDPVIGIILVITAVLMINAKQMTLHYYIRTYSRLVLANR